MIEHRQESSVDFQSVGICSMLLPQETMITEPILSTKEATTRHGGLLICGTNYGLAKGATPEPEQPYEPSVEYFTHESNRDRFAGRLIVWFEWWGIPLKFSDGTPTELNHAISQTNLFYDSSQSFELRQPHEMEFAYQRLQKTMARLSISGLLVASGRLVNETRCKLSLPEWRMIRAGRYWVGFASLGTLHVAVCPHPTSPQSRRDVECVGYEMQNWVNKVLEEKKQRQAGDK